MKQNENFREKKTNDFVYFVFDQYQREDIKIYLKNKRKVNVCYCDCTKSVIERINEIEYKKKEEEEKVMMAQSFK